MARGQHFLAAIVILLALTGCARGLETIGGYVEDVAATTAAFNDKVLRDGIVLVCDAPSAGALRRRWGNSPGAMAAWQTFCSVAPSAVAPVAFAEP